MAEEPPDKSLLLVDLAIGRFDAEALVVASLSENVLTHLIDTGTEQGRKDMRTCLHQFGSMPPFGNIGIASNGPEIPVAFVDCMDELYNLIHQPGDHDKTTNLHFFGSNTRINNGCATLIKRGLHSNAKIYVSMDRTGNASQHGNWNLHEIDAVGDVMNISKIYFDETKLAKIPVTFEIMEDTRPTHHHHHGYR
jgi:hypothetical protein